MKEVFFDLLRLVFQKTFDYLVLDRDNNEYYRKWNKINNSNEDAKKNYIEKETKSQNCSMKKSSGRPGNFLKSLLPNANARSRQLKIAGTKNLLSKHCQKNFTNVY